MNVFLHQAFMNCVNSLSTLEITTRTVPGAGIMTSESRIPLDRLIWNVRLLDALVLDEWKEADKIIDFEATVKGISIEKTPDKYFHKLVQLLQARRMLRFRPPRSLAMPRDES